MYTFGKNDISVAQILMTSERFVDVSRGKNEKDVWLGG